MNRRRILLAGGLAGVISLLLTPFETLAQVPLPSWQVRLLVLNQPAILTILAVLIGHYLAPRVGLGTPLIDAYVNHAGIARVLRRQLIAGIPVGIAVGLMLALYSLLVVPSVTDPKTASGLLSFSVPLTTRVLYGGITEEIMMRWGLVSLFAWAGTRLTHAHEPGSPIYWLAVLLAAVLFALGHLPVLFELAPDPSQALVLAVLIANGVPGVMFGWLFWKRGLEAAMIAHALAHIIAELLQA